MENRKILIKNQNWTIYGLIILLAVIARLLPHPPNFAPISGLALFSGSHFKNKFSFLIPLSAMFFSDIFLGLHQTIAYVYFSFLIIYFIGRTFLTKKTFLRIIFSSLFSSIIFFLITNFGVWHLTSMYPKTFNGLFQSYIMALPFFRNTFFSDIFYSLSFFYGFNFLKNLKDQKLFEKIIK